MNIQLWLPGSSLEAQVMLYKAEHEEQFHRDVRPHIGTDVQTFKVLPNGYPFLELLRAYLYLKTDSTHSWLVSNVHGLDPRYVWIARNFVRLSHSLNIWDERSAHGAVLSLLKEETLLHPEQFRFLEFCKNLIERVIRPILWGSPLTLSSPSPTARAWWGRPCSLSAEIDSQIQNLKTNFAYPLPEVLHSSFYTWLQNLKTWLSTKLFVSSQANALREASAMCHGLSRIHYSFGRYTLAVILCHRATDFLLFSECAAANLIDFTANNGAGELKQAIGGEKTITLLNSHCALINSGTFLQNSSRHTTFDTLNKYRNLLLLTHYMGSLTEPQAKAILSDAFKELKSIGGPTWEASSKSIFQLLKLETHDFFSLSDALMDVLVPIKVHAP